MIFVVIVVNRIISYGKSLSIQERFHLTFVFNIFTVWVRFHKNKNLIKLYLFRKKSNKVVLL